EVGKTLSGTAFDREQEREADMKAIELMSKAEIDPTHLANFLFRLSANDSDFSDELELISTHPGSKERAAQILTEIKNKKIAPIPFEFGDWELIRDPEWQGY
ncbi:MAG: M48 family metalloprotease, partial [Bacteroidia bacterium]|nr:M48 family metalloprotease [Bacteroidia bacterium]